MESIELYAMMARARAFELALETLWQQGLISGEMHLGTGEEAVAAGTVAHLREGDAVALDHRPTPVLTLLGVDLVAMLKEMLGLEDGLCHGMGGHMHLMSPDHLAAVSGIVGSAGPLAVGFGLSAKLKRPKRVALAFFGDGAANQGMLMESWNLAVAWSLPVVFVCKDNGWAVTTRTERVTGGDLLERARSFGLATEQVDGVEVEEVHRAAGALIARARRRKGPGFLHARTSRLDGHLCGDVMVRMSQESFSESKETLGKLVSATLSRGGAGIGARVASVADMMGLLRRVRRQRRENKDDPIVRCRRRLKKQKADLDRIDAEVGDEMDAAVSAALEGVAP